MHKRSIVVLAVTGALALPAFVPAAGADQDFDRPCGKTARGAITQLKAHNTTCPVARSIATGWLKKVRAGKNPAKTFKVGRYTCRSAQFSSGTLTSCLAPLERTRTRGAKFVSNY
jgi:hypothetical protein